MRTREPSRSSTVPPSAFASDSISENTTAADVGLAKTAARILRSLEFTMRCYRKLLALANSGGAALWIGWQRSPFIAVSQAFCASKAQRKVSPNRPLSALGLTIWRMIRTCRPEDQISRKRCSV